ncbi:MAG: FecCD family ABC transporter permease [bacterium]
MKKILYRILYPLSFILLAFFYFTFESDISSPSTMQMLLYIRLPRIVLAVLTGAGLAMSGAVMQTLFKNPLADPYMLGISGGALFGAMLSKLIAGGNIAVLVCMSFLFAYFSFFLSLFLSKIVKGDKRFTLIMSGLILNILFSSLVIVLSMMMKADSKDLFYLLMGSMNIIIIKKYIYLYIILGILLIFAFVITIVKSKELDLMAFGDEVAFSSGVDAKKTFDMMMIVSVFIVSVLVSFTGIIGFIGVLIPNMARVSGSRKHINLLPHSAFFGAFAMLLSDFIAKNLFLFEMPVGVVTSIIGIPFLFIVLKRRSDD